jgi:shikimate kinase
MRKDLIFLIGFMTAGKSTIGKILANTIGWNFIDLDVEIERIEKKSVIKIFKENGEEYFRNLETKTLNNFINESNLVISLGGGTVEHPENLELIINNGIVIYLEISPQEAFRRLKFKRNRPVLYNDSDEEVSDEELIERINNIFERRVHIYNKAHIKLNTDRTRVGKTVDMLVRILKRDYRIA